MIRVAFVVQRYGQHVLGGAEQGCRQLSEALSTRDDVEVEVLTTTAKDAASWADEFPEGVTVERGVTVRRFATAKERHPDFAPFNQMLVSRVHSVDDDEMAQWVDWQGPVTPGLMDHIEAHRDDFDVFVFYTYLYWPAIVGVPRLRDKAILMPAAHDEPPIYLPVFREVFGSAGGLVFHSVEERDLVHEVFDLDDVPEVVSGLGVHEHDGDPERFRREHGIDDPFLMYLGRVEGGKGVLALWEYFSAFKHRHPDSPLKLVYCGPLAAEFPPHPDVVVLGPVDEQTKWDALSASLALVNPSPFESFSIVLMESWYKQRPVLVYADCGPTRGHAARANGGLWFRRYGEFECALETLLDDPVLADELGRNGERYVRENFSWPTVAARYAQFLHDVVAARTGDVPDRTAAATGRSSGGSAGR